MAGFTSSQGHISPWLIRFPLLSLIRTERSVREAFAFQKQDPNTFIGVYKNYVYRRMHRGGFLPNLNDREGKVHASFNQPALTYLSKTPSSSHVPDLRMGIRAWYYDQEFLLSERRGRYKARSVVLRRYSFLNLLMVSPFPFVRIPISLVFS